MARQIQPTKPERAVYQCVEPFAVFHNGIPEVFGADRMVVAGDPILTTHRHHFVLAADRVEAMTARPGEYRAIEIPIPPESQPAVEIEVQKTTITETTVKEANHG